MQSKKEYTDKLFRDALAGYQRQPSGDAWSRIETRLSGKVKTKTMWRNLVAASVVFAVGISAIYMFVVTDKEGSAWADPYLDPHPDIREKIAIVEADTMNVTEAFPIHVEQGTDQPLIHESTKQLEKEKATPSRRSQKIVSNPKHIENDMLHSVDTTSLVKSVPEAYAEHIKPDKHHVIVYERDEVNKRFLKKRSPVIKNQTSGVNSSSIVMVAKRIKKNAIGLGDLRQVKDEILTFDFLVTNDKNSKDKIQ